MVPSTITHVPRRMGRVTCSPSSRIARPVEIKGLRLLIAAATGAPTFSIPLNRKKRPATVPSSPEPMKNGNALACMADAGTVSHVAIQTQTRPTVRLIQSPAEVLEERRPCRNAMVATAEHRTPVSARAWAVQGTGVSTATPVLEQGGGVGR